MKLTKISGVVERLTLSSGYENLFDSVQQNTLGAVAIGAAAIGQAFNAVALASATNSMEVDMEFFSCTVNGTPVVGKFHSVGFKEGDHMEFIVGEHDGIVISYGARCEKKRILWMLPHHIRGHQAQGRYDIKITILSSLLLTVSATILFSFMAPFPDFLSMAYTAAGIFLISILVLWWVRSHFAGFAYFTTSILHMFGYHDPENVDLAVNEKLANKITKPTEILPPWTFRY